VATVAAIALFALLGVYGLIVPSVTLFEMLFVLGLSAIFTLAIDYPKYLAFKAFGL